MYKQVPWWDDEKGLYVFIRLNKFKVSYFPELMSVTMYFIVGQGYFKKREFWRFGVAKGMEYLRTIKGESVSGVLIVSNGAAYYFLDRFVLLYLFYVFAFVIHFS